MAVSVVYPCDYGADRKLGLPVAAQHQDRIVLRTASPGKEQNSKWEVQSQLNATAFVPP